MFLKVNGYISIPSPPKMTIFVGAHRQPYFCLAPASLAFFSPICLFPKNVTFSARRFFKTSLALPKNKLVKQPNHNFHNFSNILSKKKSSH